MYPSIKGGLWALVLGGAGLSYASFMSPPPVAIDPAQVQGGQVAVPAVIDPNAEPAPIIAVDLGIMFEAPALETPPEAPALTQKPLILALHSGVPNVPQVPENPVILSQPAAPLDTQIANAPAVAAPAPQQSPVAVTQTAPAPSVAPAATIISPTPETGSEEDVPAEVDALPEDAPALLRFAAPFENPEGLPVIGLVLIDDGTLTDGPVQILESGLVATVAVSPLMDDATLWAEAYREAGSEVAMQMPLPDGATPMDAEVSLAAAFEILPETGLFYSDGDGVLRNDRFVAAQVMQILSSEGRGFVTFQRGLGSLVREAERSGVSVITALRDIDGAGETNSAIERGLDQAAFRARQLGGVVIVARLKPRTLSVLREWAFDNQRNGILLGPVSALLVEPPAQEPVATEGAAIEGEQPESGQSEGETPLDEPPAEDSAAMPSSTE